MFLRTGPKLVVDKNVDRDRQCENCADDCRENAERHVAPQNPFVAAQQTDSNPGQGEKEDPNHADNRKQDRIGYAECLHIQTTRSDQGAQNPVLLGKLERADRVKPNGLRVHLVRQAGKLHRSQTAGLAGGFEGSSSLGDVWRLSLVCRRILITALGFLLSRSGAGSERRGVGRRSPS